jgi:hypothetical protein
MGKRKQLKKEEMQEEKGGGDRLIASGYAEFKWNSKALKQAKGRGNTGINSSTASGYTEFKRSGKFKIGHTTSSYTLR